eukprot:4220257-Pyramimonas_sp.AAC.1
MFRAGPRGARGADSRTRAHSAAYLAPCQPRAVAPAAEVLAPPARRPRGPRLDVAWCLHRRVAAGERRMHSRVVAEILRLA